jgi:hypothetical protein
MLTDTKLRSLCSSPPAERMELNDGTISGLIVRVGPRGRPTWTLRYTVKGRGGTTERGKKLAGRKFYRITLGEYPSVSLLKARAQAATMLADADPFAKWARTEDCPIGELPFGFEADARRTPARTCFNAGRTSDAERPMRIRNSFSSCCMTSASRFDGGCRQLAIGPRNCGGSAASASKKRGGLFYVQTGGWRQNRRSIFILHS